MQVELIDHIRNELSDFELDYQEGAWERFEKTRRPRKVPVWSQLIGRAAILTICFSLFWLRLSKDEHVMMLVANRKVNTIESSVPVTILKKMPEQRMVKKTILRSVSAITAIVEKPKASTITEEVLATTDVQAARTAKDPGLLKPGLTSAERMAKLLAEDSDNDIGSQAKMGASKWKIGVSIAETMDSRSKGKLNYGVSLAYRVSPKLSVASGLFYTQLGGQRTPGPASYNMLVDKKLTSSVVAMGGIEMPFNLNYHLTPKIQVGGGVSAYSVTSVTHTREYTEDRVVVSDLVDANGIAYTETRRITEVSTEAVAPAQLPRQKIFGLYQFSVGFEQPLTVKTSLTLEPFVKIPFSRFSTESINMGQAGLRLKFGF